MTIVRAAEGVVHDLHGSRFISYAAPSRSSRELAAWRLEVPPATTGTAHRITREEVLHVLSGALRLTLDGMAHDLSPGDVAVMAAGTEVRLDTTAGSPATAWVTTSAGLHATLPDGSWISPPWAR